MTLLLDKRHRAMLREIGVRVWQPTVAHALQHAVPLLDASTTTDAAPDLIAASAHKDWADGISDIKVAPESGTTVAPPARVPAPAHQAPAPANPVSASTGAVPGWQLGQTQTLYAEAASTDGPCWLLLAETPAASLRAEAFDPLAGDAGRLLGNMLRAARLDRSDKAPHPGTAGAVLLAPLARMAAGGGAPQALVDALAEVITNTRPDIILVMGRLVAQALLQSSEPLGKLRGQVHTLHGVRTVITYDAAYLLRSPLEKAKAWEDLCLAADVAQRTD